MLITGLIAVLAFQSWCSSFCEAKKVHIRKRAYLREITSCSDKTYPTKLQNANVFNTPGGDILTSADWNFTEPAKKVAGTLVIQKCTSPLPTDCEHFLKLNFNHLCTLFVEKDQLYTPIFASVSPTFKCPIRKMVYQQRNGTWDIKKLFEQERTIPFLTDYLWRFRFLWKRLPDNTDFFCYIGLVECTKVKSAS